MISKSCPPFSLSACHCVHGKCNSGLLGTGHCRPDSCHLGYQGQDCNICKYKAGIPVTSGNDLRDLCYLIFFY